MHDFHINYPLNTGQTNVIHNMVCSLNVSKKLKSGTGSISSYCSLLKPKHPDGYCSVLCFHFCCPTLPSLSVWEGRQEDKDWIENKYTMSVVCQKGSFLLFSQHGLGEWKVSSLLYLHPKLSKGCPYNSGLEIKTPWSGEDLINTQ